MSSPINVLYSPNRDAMLDALKRATIGIDNNDVSLFDSAWSTSVEPAFSAFGTKTEGLKGIKDRIFYPIGPLDTTHFTTNVRLLAESDHEGTVFAYALAYHYRAGEGQNPGTEKLLSSSQYHVDVVKEGDLWKIKSWTMKVIWIEGHSDILPSTKQ